MKMPRLCAVFALAYLTLAQPLQAQRANNRAQERQEELRTESWPPERAYTKVSLGYAMQRVFRKHFDFCGFSAPPERRDFIPPDISKFLGRRTLRTKVETANISGGGLMFYVFHQTELALPLDVISYSSTRLLTPPGYGPAFTLDPDTHFDAFVFTKNCSGYLKSSLDAGIEPPYSAFKTALTTDERRESSVVALSGSFVSPLRGLIDLRDARTTDLMMRLWHFYQQNPAYIGKAYYLREFEGVMVKHLGTAEDARRVDAEIGMNINGPLNSNIKANLGSGRATGGSFSGTDWETIVFADYEGAYSRNDLFAPLPGPADIQAYFAGLRPVFQKPKDFPLMTEGAEHRHYLIVEGLPEEICRQPWIVENVQPGVYAGPLRWEASYFREDNGLSGGRFTITGQPDPSLFTGSVTERPGQVRLSYTLRSLHPVGGSYLRLTVNEELPTSAHPIVGLAQGRFDLSIQEDRRFALQWKCLLEIEDEDNPIDFATTPYISQIKVWRGDQSALEVHLADIRPDPERHCFVLTLQSRETWPLDRIDDKQMLNYNLSMEVHLQSRRAPVRSIRQVRGFLSFPDIKTERPAPNEIPMPAPTAPTSSGNGNGG